MPVDAVIAPAKLTVKALAPTANGAVGAQVPIPTLPLVMVKLPCGVVVPMPILPPVNKAELVALENVGVPVKVLADVPLWV